MAASTTLAADLLRHDARRRLTKPGLGEERMRGSQLESSSWTFSKFRGPASGKGMSLNVPAAWRP
jgi:hypothetical protein